jgi:hypothetical protein
VQFLHSISQERRQRDGASAVMTGAASSTNQNPDIHGLMVHRSGTVASRATVMLRVRAWIMLGRASVAATL